MPHYVLIGAEDAPGRFRWNLDYHVGPFCQNIAEDVQLIQFAYFCMARNPFPLDKKLMDLASKITPGDPYNGTASETLSQCIVRHQQLRGGVVDGKVSPMNNATGSYGPGASWMLIPLNLHMAVQVKDLWPRITDHPSVPPALGSYRPGIPQGQIPVI